MIRCILLAALVCLSACQTSPRPRLILKADTIEVPVLQMVAVSAQLTEEIPAPMPAPKTATWTDETGKSVATAKLGGITEERDAYKEAFGICLGRLAAIRAIKPTPD